MADTKLVFICWFCSKWLLNKALLKSSNLNRPRMGHWYKKYRFLRAPYEHHVVKRLSVCMFLLACSSTDKYRPVNIYRYSGLQYLLLFCVIHYNCICTYILYSKSITNCSCIGDLGTELHARTVPVLVKRISNKTVSDDIYFFIIYLIICICCSLLLLSWYSNDTCIYCIIYERVYARIIITSHIKYLSHHFLNEVLQFH
jgi:hypothetical protein